jgi:hypothetical protein
LCYSRYPIVNSVFRHNKTSAISLISVYHFSPYYKVNKYWGTIWFIAVFNDILTAVVIWGWSVDFNMFHTVTILPYFCCNGGDQHLKIPPQFQASWQHRLFTLDMGSLKKNDSFSFYLFITLLLVFLYLKGVIFF